MVAAAAFGAAAAGGGAGAARTPAEGEGALDFENSFSKPGPENTVAVALTSLVVLALLKFVWWWLGLVWMTTAIAIKYSIAGVLFVFAGVLLG